MQSHYQVTHTTALSELLRSIDSMKKTISERRAQANGNLSLAIQEKLRFLWTYHSNAIEGSKLSLGDTIFFLQEGLTVGGKRLKDFLDATNHSEAIDYLRDVIQQERRIDCHLLRSINALLLKGIDTIPAIDKQGKPFQKVLKAGQYKTDPNYVVQPDGSIHKYVEPHLVKEQLTTLCQWVNQSQEQPVVIASVAHYNFVRIHPFQDGNGRGARLLMNLILMQHGHTPAIIEIEQREAYLGALKKADNADLTAFIELVAASTHQTQTNILSEIDRYFASK